MFTRNNSFPLVLPGNLFRALELHDKFVQDVFANKNIFSNYPPTDVYYQIDDDKTIFMDIIVAGFSKEEIEISVTNNVITVKGEHKNKSKNENTKYINQSISYKNFERSLIIDDEKHLMIDSVEPIIENGLLRVKIVVKQPEIQEQRKLIPIQ